MRINKWIIALCALVVASCQDSDTGKLEVTGELKNMQAAMAQFPGVFQSDSIKLYLLEVPFGSEAAPIKLDSTYVTPTNNKFTLSGQVTMEGLYDVMFANGTMMIPLVNDQNKIHIEINLLDREKYYTVQGSAASEELRSFIFGYSEKSQIANSAFKMLDSLKMYNASDSLVMDATDRKNNSLAGVNEFVEKFIAQAGNPVVAAFALGTGSSTMSEEKYEDVLNKTVAKHPSDANLHFLKTQLAERQKQVAQPQETSWIGKPAPDLTMPDVNDKPVSLSSFKGKYVLVDFWASWCGPCRQENPNVVKAYNSFKNKNFTVLGVSLDKEKDSWVEAIKKDHLTWTHISDLAFWNSKAVELYKFQGIPFNVLIDPDGIVIGESLRGDELIGKLKEVIK